MLNKESVRQYFIPLLPIPTHLNPSGHVDGTLNGILFDIYGTLFVSAAGDISSLQRTSDKMKTLQRLLLKYNIDKDASVLIKEYVDHVSEKHASLQKKGIEFPEIHLDRVWEEIIGYSGETLRNFITEYELIINPVAPMPYLKELISACKASGMVMGIISNAQFYTEYLFHWFLGAPPEDLGFHKDLIYYSYRTGHAKPSMHMFQNALVVLNDMGVRASSVLYMGNDMLNDVFPAKKAGFKTALFAGDARSLKLREDDPKCRDIVPDMIVTDLRQLISYID